VYGNHYQHQIRQKDKSDSEKGTFVQNIIDSNQSIKEELGRKIQEAIINKNKGSA
jgi:hypothetical protein